jgi:hypothetical protein
METITCDLSGGLCGRMVAELDDGILLLRWYNATQRRGSHGPTM